jgi:hypothetical protein
MAFGDGLQYNVENFSLWFQGGVRRGILIFFVVSLALLAPFYFLGQFTSSLYKNVWFDSKNLFIPKTLDIKKYTISQSQVAPLINDQNDIYVSVDNKINPNIGYWPWVYTVQILDKNGTILSQETQESYLLPGDVTYIVGKNRDVGGTQIKIIEEPATQSVYYNPEANSILKKPDIEVLSSGFTESDTNKNEINIYAYFKNNDFVTIKSVDVLYIVRDTQQAVVGIGTYNFRGFTPGSERDMKIPYPKPKERVAKFIELRWFVNYLDSNSIVR